MYLKIIKEVKYGYNNILNVGEIVELIEVYLQSEGYQTLKAYAIAETRELITNNDIDLAIFDVMLPDGNGFSLCKEVREKYLFPVIMLTAKGEEVDKITGLTFGADDYVVKPFRPLELIARIKAQLRRNTKYNTSEKKEADTYKEGNLVLNVKAHECIVSGKVLDLTPTEFTILQILFENMGQMVSSEDLFHGIWGDEYYNKNNNTIATHIRHIREKINDSFDSPQYIKTVWGVGYRIG